MDFEPGTYAVDKLISMIQSGRLGLPEFQRDFVWSPSKVVELLDSVARGWPIGSLLLLKGPQPFAAKPIDSAPPLGGAPDIYVLDGQQRLTALYHAIEDKSEVVYVVDFDALGSGYPDYIKWYRRKEFFTSYPDLESRAAHKIALVSDIWDTEAFYDWYGLLPAGAAKHALALRERDLAGLRSRTYRLVVIELEQEIELEALARIFETINRTGMRLNAFDLMVAVLFPHEFNLSDEWEWACLECEKFGKYDVKGIELLKLIALWARREQQQRGEKLTVKGVRQGDVLAIPPRLVKLNWDRAKTSYVAALSYLESRLGVVSAELMPPQAMVLVLAALLDSPEFDEATVNTWYWRSIISQAYSQGANTRVVTDIDSLYACGDTRAEVPAGDALAATLREPIRRNKVLLRGLGAALVVTGAGDPFSGQPLKELSDLTYRSLDAIREGHARPDESAPVASMIFGSEAGFRRYAAQIKRGIATPDDLIGGALSSQWLLGGVVSAGIPEIAEQRRADELAMLLLAMVKGGSERGQMNG